MLSIVQRATRSIAWVEVPRDLSFSVGQLGWAQIGLRISGGLIRSLNPRSFIASSGGFTRSLNPLSLIVWMCVILRTLFNLDERVDVGIRQVQSRAPHEWMTVGGCSQHTITVKVGSDVSNKKLEIHGDAS